jgi:hypothetical protein
MKIILSILLLCLMGCQKLESGVVIDGHHEPARSWVSIMPIYTGKTMMMIPMIHFDDEDWIIIVEGEHDGELRQETWYVSEAQYTNIEIGDNVNYSELKCDRSDPVVKTKKR